MIKHNRYLALEGDDDDYGKWHYYGEAKEFPDYDGNIILRHGYGTCTWSWTGFAYRGEWEYGSPNGWGVTTFSDGAVFQGAWWSDIPMGLPGTLYMSDGVRCFVGTWYDTAIPKKGAMMEANGDVFYARNEEVEERRFRFYTDRCGDLDCETAWATALKADSGLERTLVGRVVEGGGPMPSGEVRAVRVELADGGTYLGPMRGLSFCSVGVRTDARGGAWRVKHFSEHDEFEDKDWVCMPYTEDEVDEDYDGYNHGQSTFAEGQEPDAKEVHHPERIAMCFAYTFKFSNVLTYCSFFRAAAEAV